MLTKFILKLKRRTSPTKRIVMMPCAWCSTWCKPEEMVIVGLNDQKCRICKACLN